MFFLLKKPLCDDILFVLFGGASLRAEHACTPTAIGKWRKLKAFPPYSILER